MPPHEHQWLDITCLEDAARQLVCECGASRAELHDDPADQ